MIRFASPRGARGVSMIEVLVAIVIFSLGLLGLAMMQLKGASFTKDSGARSVAVLQARSLADRMQANPTALAEYATATSTGGIPGYTDCSPNCTSTQVADNDVNAWLTQMRAALPASAGSTAMGKVLSNGDGTYTITVTWSGQGIAGQSSESDSFVFVPRAGG